GDRLIATAVPGIYQPGDLKGAVSATIPADAAPGKYFIGLCADATNLLDEADEFNNCPSQPITVVSNPDPSPDVRTTNLTASTDTATAGSYLTLSFSVKNFGSAVAKAPSLNGNGFRTTLFWSTDSQLTHKESLYGRTSDLVLGVVSSPSLNPG